MDTFQQFGWILWMIALPVGPVLGWLLQRFWGNLHKWLRRTLLVLFAGSAAIGASVIYTSWSFRGFWLQAIVLVLAYISATTLGCVSLKSSAKYYSRIAARCLAFSIVMLIYYGLWVAYGRTNASEIPTRLGDQLVLRRSSGGLAGTYWDDVTIVEQPVKLPFLERTLYKMRIGDVGDCDETSVRVDPDPLTREIRVQCGRQHPYVFARVRMP